MVEDQTTASRSAPAFQGSPRAPRDTWIPPAILSLERLYAKVDSDEARAHAKSVMAWLVRDYPSSAPGKIGRRELAENRVGVKPAPLPQSSNATVAGGDVAIPAK